MRISKVSAWCVLGILVFPLFGCTSSRSGFNPPRVMRPEIGVRVRVSKADTFVPALPPGWLQGLLVVQVKPRSPAAQAGILPGDVVLAVDGQPVSSSLDSLPIMRAHKTGDRISVTAWYHGQSRELTVELN